MYCAPGGGSCADGLGWVLRGGAVIGRGGGRPVGGGGPVGRGVAVAAEVLQWVGWLGLRRKCLGDDSGVADEDARVGGRVAARFRARLPFPGLFRGSTP